jgi:hypothetical protein
MRIVERAGETLTPLAAWLLVQIDRNPDYDPFELARKRAIPADRVETALNELRARRLIADSKAAATGRERLTSTGCDVLDRLVSARREHLSELAAEWDPAHHPNVADYLRSTGQELIPDARRAG